MYVVVNKSILSIFISIYRSSEWLKCHPDDYSEVIGTHGHCCEETFFYMDIKDFVQYFEEITIGSLIPDFKFNAPTNMGELVYIIQFELEK